MNQLDGRRKESLEPSWFCSMKWSSSELLRLQLKTSAPRANPSSCHCPDTMNNYWELFWIKSGEFSFVPVSRVAWFGKSFHGTTSTPSWSSVCIFKSQQRTDPDLSPGKTGFASTSVYQLRKKRNALLLDFFFFISYCKMPTLQAFLQCKQSKHPSGSASYPKQSREKHDIQKSLVIHPPSQATKYFMFHTLIKHFFFKASYPAPCWFVQNVISELSVVGSSFILSFF